MSQYCRTCGYILDRLTRFRCPECGRCFDPLDPLTISTTDPRRRLVLRRYGFAALCASVLAAGSIIYFLSTYSRIHVLSICANCGQSLDSDRFTVAGIVAFSLQQSPKETGLSSILEVDCADGRHRWRQVSSRATDFRERTIAGSNTTEPALWMLVNKVGSDSRLHDLCTTAPELPVMIRDGILQEDDPDRLLRRVGILNDLCTHDDRWLVPILLSGW
jgi:hypothetical protein